MTEAVTIAIIGAVVAIVNTVITALVKRDVRQYHEQVNGHMSKYLALTKKDGVQEGKDKQIAKDKRK